MDVIAIIIALTVLFRVLKMHPDIRKVSPKIGIFGYRIIYTDQKEKKKKSSILYNKLLHSNQYGLTGKPDYIYQKIFGADIVPVELKSGKIKDKAMPNKGDMFQLLSYFLIIEEEYGIAPQTGRLIYDDAMFIIKNTDYFREQLVDTINQMRNFLATGELDGHYEAQFAKCRSCLCRTTVCEISDI